MNKIGPWLFILCWLLPVHPAILPNSRIEGGLGGAWVSIREPQISGGVIEQLIADPGNANHLIALQDQTGGKQTIVESWDAATHWHALANLFQFWFHSLAIDPVHTNVIYAGSDTGLYRTMNGGRNWVHVADFGPLISVPSGDAIYAIDVRPGASDCVPGPASFVSSADQGHTWETTPLRCGTYGEITSSRSDPELIYLRAIDYASGNQMLAQSRDAGHTWVYRQLTGPLFVQGMFPIVIDPYQPQKLFSSSGSGIIVSQDAGQTWRSTLDIPGNGSFVFCFSRDGIYAGLKSTLAGEPGALYRSQDEGMSWTRLPVQFPANLDALLMPARSKRIYAGLDGFGVMLSPDSGQSWRPANEGLLSTTLTTRLVTSFHQPNLFFAVTNWPRPGLFKTSDGGLTWVGPLLETQNSDVTIDPRNEKLVWAIGPGGWSESIDGGDHWRLVSLLGGSDLAVSSAAPDRPCATHSSEGQGFLVCRTFTQMRQETWESFIIPNSKVVSGLAISPSRENLIFVGGTPDYEETAIYKSEDGGNTWMESFRGPQNYVLFDLALSDGDPARVIAVLGQYHPDQLQVYESQDSGKTWLNITPQMEAIAGNLWTGDTHKAAVLVDNSGTTYFAAGNVVLAQPAIGQSWRVLGTINDRIDAGAIDSGSSGLLWLAGENYYWRVPLPNWFFNWMPAVFG